MPICCALIECNKVKGIQMTENDGKTPLHFFGFPNRIKERGRFNMWIHLSGRSGEREEEFESKHVCSEHFQPQDILGNRHIRARLSSNAIPTLNLPSCVLESIDSTEPMERQLRKLALDSQGKFFENWNPENSNRETRKLTRKIYHEGSRKHISYDEFGILIRTEKDLCDCLEEDCSGCHMPCSKCGSCKCGHECRNSRRWTYDLVEVEGSDCVIKNKFK